AVITAQADTYIHNPVYTFYDQNGNVLLPGPTDPPNQRTKCNMQPSDAGNYTVTVTDGTLTSAPAGVKIGVVDPKPPMIDGKVDFCLNDPFTPVTVIGSAPFNYYYTQTGGSPLPFVPYFNTTTANEADFWVSQTVNGCPSPRTNIHYRAAPKPNAPIVTTPIYYCENSTASQLSANGQKPLKWYYQPTGGIPSQVAPTPNTTKLDSFQYYVTQTVDGCESDRSRIDVVVARRPNGLILPSRTEICQGDTVMLGYYGSAFPTSGYNWEYPSDAVPMSKDSNTVVVAFDSAGKHSIKLSVGIETCHSPEYIQEIQVDAKPVAIIESGDRICENQRVQISLSYYTPTIDSFFWDFDGGVVSNASTDQGPYGVTWSTPGKKNIQLRLVDGVCNGTYIDTPNVHPKPDATFTLDKKTGPYCYDDSLLFTANTIASGSTYSWTPARFFDIYNNLPTAYGHLDYQDTASIKLTVTDQYGCMNTEAKVLQTKPCCEVLFPTAFSPNHDGKNDYFHPIIMGHQEIRTLKVMNRWGQTVYEAVNIGQGWDGTMNGKELEMGTYYYFLSYKCAGKSMEQKGEIVLVH
ncbi:MAG: gliding motility-associated C-terminal domain-containing protein, partial [Flavipsychrobacter sp.]